MRNPSPTIPMSFVQNLRMGATRVLAPENIDDLVRQAGFDNTPVLHRAFRVWIGSSPGAYRR